ncbi:MAG: hypothetical protein SFU83_22725 [Meiothermus sp.]|nr:hypothetical protein [Meiothermus sp.]
MKKLIGSILAVGVLVVGGAFAQVNTQPLMAQIQTVAKLVQKTENGVATRTGYVIKDYPYLFSQPQIEALLPYLREIRALPSLTQADVNFYTAKIASILTDAQRKDLGLPASVAVGASIPAVTGGGTGGTGGTNFVAVVANPMLDEGPVSMLDHVIIVLAQWESNFTHE